MHVLWLKHSNLVMICSLQSFLTVNSVILTGKNAINPIVISATNGNSEVAV